MTTPRRFRLNRCVPLLVLAACSVEGRSLSYGSSGPSGPSEAGRGHSASGGSDGGQATGDGGEVEPGAAGATATAGKTPVGGAPSPVGGTQGGGGADSQAGGVTSGGVTSGGATAGQAGGGTSLGGSTIDQGRCGDLDANGVQDCEETVVENSTFDANAQHWSPDVNITTGWTTDDALDRSGSGSLSVKLTTADGSGAWATSATGQCVPAWEGTQLELGGRALVPTGQGSGNAEINLALFGNDACAGSFLGMTPPLFTTTTGVWQPLHGSVKLPAGTRSVLLRLAITKPGTHASLEAHFDNVLLHAK